MVLGAFSSPFSFQEEVEAMMASEPEVVPGVAFGLQGAEESLAASSAGTSMGAALEFISVNEHRF